MVNVITSIEILRPVDEVSQFASDPDNATTWYKNIKLVEWKTPKPLQIGSKIAFVAKFLGKRLAYTYEVVEISNAKFVMKTTEGPFPMETTYTWQKVNETTTKMFVRNCGEPSGFSKLFAPVMSLMMKRANKKDLQKLKQILERT